KANIKRADAAMDRLIKPARPGHLTADRVQSALASLRAQGRSLQTVNHHRAAIRAFGKWLHETHRVREDTLSVVRGYNATEDRRPISLDELHRLIDAAEKGDDFLGMTGPARALAYRLAVATGLRYSELASLTPQSFDFGDRPSVTVQAAYAKNGQIATLFVTR